MASSPRDLQPLVHALINVLFVIGEGSALARIWVKWSVLKNFGWDDWFMVAVAIANCVQHAFLYLFVSAGAGLPTKEVLENDPAALSKIMKALFTEEIWYPLVHFLIKMSFLLFFLRLSQDRIFRKCVIVVIASNVLVTVGSWLLYCLQCTPIEALWNPAEHPDAQCVSFGLALWPPAVALVVVDWAIFLLPLSTVMPLRMKLVKRLQVLAVLTTGGSSVLVSSLRLIVVNEFVTTDDLIWVAGKMCIVTATEIEFAILAANMPALHTLWSSWRSGTLSSSLQLKASSSNGFKNRGAAGLGSIHLSRILMRGKSNEDGKGSNESRAKDHQDCGSPSVDGSSMEFLTRPAGFDEELGLRGPEFLCRSSCDENRPVGAEDVGVTTVVVESGVK